MKKENEKPRGTEEGVTFPSITFGTGWKGGKENAKLYHQALHSTILRPGFSVLSRSDSEIEDVEKAPHPSSFPPLAADELAKKLLEEEDGSPPIPRLSQESVCERESERPPLR